MSDCADAPIGKATSLDTPPQKTMNWCFVIGAILILVVGFLLVFSGRPA